MKQLTILVVTIIVVFAAGIWEISYLEESSKYFRSDASDVYQIAERGDFDSAKAEAKKLQESWKDIRKSWAVFLDDSHLDKIGENLSSFVSYVELKNKEEIYHSYKKLSNNVKEVVEFQCLKAENVF